MKKGALDTAILFLINSIFENTFLPSYLRVHHSSVNNSSLNCGAATGTRSSTPASGPQPELGPGRCHTHIAHIITFAIGKMLTSICELLSLATAVPRLLAKTFGHGVFSEVKC